MRLVFVEQLFIITLAVYSDSGTDALSRISSVGAVLDEIHGNQSIPSC
jgi:hypothetical protein